MSRPVHAVASAHDISAALVECQRLGLSGIQVSEDGELTGVVAREDLDRAVRHGLSHAPVKGVMSAGVPVIGGEATLGELRELLAGGAPSAWSSCRRGRTGTEEHGAGSTAAQGVVTRGDVLRALHEPLTLERPVPDPEATAAVRERLERSSGCARSCPRSRPWRRAYDGVYLVGGAVRDVLLGEQSLDLDVMVEGDAIAFARELAASSAAVPSAREVPDRGREGRDERRAARSASTSRPRAPSSTARPARCPRSSARRCATTSRAATSRSTRWRPRCKADDLGATYDFFGGYRDLRQGTVRVLHNLSFVEDPTRLLRAVRYEARLGFRMDAHTLSLARGCIDVRLVGDLSSARLRDELLDMLAEPSVRPRRSRGWPSSGSTGRCTRASTPARTRWRWSSARDELMAQAPFARRRRAARWRLACLCLEMPPTRCTGGWRSCGSAPRPGRGGRGGDARPADRGAAVGRSRAGAVGAARAARGPAARGARDGGRCSLRTSARPRSACAPTWSGCATCALEITGDDLRAAGVPESPGSARR